MGLDILEFWLRDSGQKSNIKCLFRGQSETICLSYTSGEVLRVTKSITTGIG